MSEPQPRRTLCERRSRAAETERVRARHALLGVLAAGLLTTVVWGAAQRTALWGSDLDDRGLRRRLATMQFHLEERLRSSLGPIPIRSATEAEITRHLLGKLPSAHSWQHAEQRRLAVGRYSTGLLGFVPMQGEPKIWINRTLLRRYNHQPQRDGPAILDMVLIHEAVHVYQRQRMARGGLIPKPAKEAYWERERRETLTRVLMEGHAELVTLEVCSELKIAHAFKQYDPSGDLLGKALRAPPKEGPADGEALGFSKQYQEQMALLDLDRHVAARFVSELAQRVGLPEVFPYLQRFPPTAIEVLRPIRYLKRRGFWKVEPEAPSPLVAADRRAREGQ